MSLLIVAGAGESFDFMTLFSKDQQLRGSGSIKKLKRFPSNTMRFRRHQVVVFDTDTIGQICISLLSDSKLSSTSLNRKLDLGKATASLEVTIQQTFVAKLGPFLRHFGFEHGNLSKSIFANIFHNTAFFESSIQNKQQHLIHTIPCGFLFQSFHESSFSNKSIDCILLRLTHWRNSEQNVGAV